MATKDFDKSIEASKCHNTVKILPSKIRTDHRNNHSRSALYTVLDKVPELSELPEFGDAFCFTLAQVEKRLTSLKIEGQIHPVRGYKTSTGFCVLKEGYLRHAAFCLAEVRGELDQIPNARVDGVKGKKYGIRIELVPAPTKSEDHVAAIWSNTAENDEQLARTPLDTAWLIKRAFVMQETQKSIAAKLKMSERSVDRYHSLLALSPTVQLDIHEGRTTMSVALAKASKDGEGTGRGARPGVPHKLLRRAFAAIKESGHGSELLESDQIFTVEEMLSALSWVAGVENGEPPEVIKAFIEGAPPKPPKKSGRPKKKAPPKPGKKVDDDG